MAQARKTTATKPVQKAVAARPAQKAVAAAKSTALVSNELDAELARDQGAGFEEAGRDAYAIPFLVALQDMSPQTKAKMAGYVEGAKPGNLFNTATGELMDDCIIIPCHYAQTFIEWVPRDQGGGFVNAYPPGHAIISTAVRDGSLNVLPNGNHLSDTRQHYVLIVKEDGTTEGAILAMKSTQLKVSRRWMTQMRSQLVEVNGRSIPAPMFAFQYRLSTELEANDKGQWSSFLITDRERVTDVNAYREAKQFAALAKSGSQKVDYNAMNAGGNDSGGNGDDQGPSDADMPNDIDA